jgi:hypothetical protein
MRRAIVLAMTYVAKLRKLNKNKYMKIKYLLESGADGIGW